MEVKPYHITVSVSYPPDTDTPMYKEEMKTKPAITKEISDSGAVLSPVVVAHEIVQGAEAGYFTISHGLEGWALKQLHAGMSPINHTFEVIQQVWFGSLIRFVTCFYLVFWEFLVAKHAGLEEKNKANKAKKSS